QKNGRPRAPVLSFRDGRESEAVLGANGNHVGAEVHVILLGVVVVVVEAQADVVGEVVAEAHAAVPVGLVQAGAHDRGLVVAHAVAFPGVQAGTGTDVPVGVDVEVAIGTQ